MGSCQRYFWDDIVKDSETSKQTDREVKAIVKNNEDKAPTCTCHGMEGECIC